MAMKTRSMLPELSMNMNLLLNLATRNAAIVAVRRLQQALARLILVLAYGEVYPIIVYRRFW